MKTLHRNEIVEHTNALFFSIDFFRKTNKRGDDKLHAIGKRVTGMHQEASCGTTLTRCWGLG